MARKPLPAAVLDYFRKEGSRGATMQAAAMTPAQRKARATKASRAAALVRTAKRKAAIDAAVAQLTDLERKRATAKRQLTRKTKQAKG
jgi:hypothetical protein